MNIGSRLKEILEERGINVSQFAKDAGVPAQTIYAMIKRDSNKADMNIMAKILAALEMDFMEFLKMEPIKKKAKPQKEKQVKKVNVEKVEEKQEERRPVRRELEDYLL